MLSDFTLYGNLFSSNFSFSHLNFIFIPFYIFLYSHSFKVVVVGNNWWALFIFLFLFIILLFFDAIIIKRTVNSFSYTRKNSTKITINTFFSYLKTSYDNFSFNNRNFIPKLKQMYNGFLSLNKGRVWKMLTINNDDQTNERHCWSVYNTMEILLVLLCCLYFVFAFKLWLNNWLMFLLLFVHYYNCSYCCCCFCATIVEINKKKSADIYNKTRSNLYVHICTCMYIRRMVYITTATKYIHEFSLNRVALYTTKILLLYIFFNRNFLGFLWTKNKILKMLSIPCH